MAATWDTSQGQAPCVQGMKSRAVCLEPPHCRKQVHASLLKEKQKLREKETCPRSTPEQQSPERLASLWDKG